MSARIAAQDRTLHFELGQRTRDIRLKLHLTMMDAGNELGISFSQISRKEHGQHNYTPAELMRLAKLYKCKVGDFFKGLKI